MFNDLKKALSFGGATTPEKRRTSTLMGRSRKETSEKRNNSQDPEDDNESHTSVVTHERKFCMAQQILATILENKEQVNMMMDISGQVCFVSASYRASLVYGKVCRYYCSKEYTFEFTPL